MGTIVIKTCRWGDGIYTPYIFLCRDQDFFRCIPERYAATDLGLIWWAMKTNIEAECVGSGFHREVVEFAE
jgi:hypothetical protein